MRVVKYFKEEECFCGKCLSTLAYTSRDLYTIDSGDFVDNVGEFVNSLLTKEKEQIGKEKLKILNAHKDYVICGDFHTVGAICPVCGKKLKIGTIYDYLEIYPEQGPIPEGGDPDGLIKILNNKH